MIDTRYGLAWKKRATAAPMCINRFGDGAGGSSTSSTPNGFPPPSAAMTLLP
ncbi:MAG: hypothetical protein R2710_06345 [Acidimicrobiales bacterium]